MIQATELDQLLMSALFNDASLFEDDDKVYYDTSAHPLIPMRNNVRNVPASTTVRRRWAIKMLVRALSNRMVLMFFINSDSVCASNADVCVCTINFSVLS